jgi:NAD(P)H-dependent flavin oxidoreductase YrpB (nitropropane dioxygenase family)
VNEGSELPQIIQGGMGVGVSSWRLANTVARAGQLGVVSGSMLDTVLVRRLQDGDPDGHVRRAAAHFPIPGVAERILNRYFRHRGRPAGTPYALLPLPRRRMSAERERVTMLANFVEVWLAKEGHAGTVGLNLLTKVQMPNLASLYGAMLAGVNCVIMGAGIPREIPGVLDAFAEHRPARLRFEVEGIKRDAEDWLELDPAAHWPSSPEGSLRRPRFIAVVSAASLAATLARKSNGRVDGFVVEGPTAGGHNAPPRGQMRLNERGEPVYGDRDVVDLADMRALGLPFWIAGGAGSPEALARARADGAAGIQVGTLFAYSDESGIAPEVKHQVLEAVRRDAVTVVTDPRASPTGYPFKVVSIDGRPPAERERICDLGYLRVAVRTERGIIYRCPAEPVDAYVAKGGDVADTVGRHCLCNGLTSTIGLAQARDGAGVEPPLITSGDDLVNMRGWLGGRTSYGARDVLDYLLSSTTPASGNL